MDLLLWRHADASELEDELTGSDLDRPLTRKGERQAQRMASWLDRQLPEKARILVSPALRTRQTAAALDRKSRVVDGLGPDACVETLLNACRWPEAQETTVIVGHQPTLGQLASYLITGAPGEWSVRKGSVWWLKRRERNGRSEVVIHSVISPELLG
jgi:phosphohistidine phosphatase